MAEKKPFKALFSCFFFRFSIQKIKCMWNFWESTNHPSTCVANFLFCDLFYLKMEQIKTIVTISFFFWWLKSISWKNNSATRRDFSLLFFLKQTKWLFYFYKSKKIIWQKFFHFIFLHFHQNFIVLWYLLDFFFKHFKNHGN